MERIEEEKKRIQRADEERTRRTIEEKRREFEEKCKEELNEFQSLFTMAERMYKANIIRDYIHTYEIYVKKNGVTDEKVLRKIEWAKDKADWLDPFISKEDIYLDKFKIDEIIQPKCSTQHYRNEPIQSENFTVRSFWQKPWWKK